MALDFNKTKGKAQRASYESYKFVEGDQAVRLFGGILPRYVYWFKSSNGKDIPVECLSFDRNLEKFTNSEDDVVKERYPDKKSSWSYSANCIDLKDGKAKVFNFKKKLFEQILAAAEDLGDPTDTEKGWDIVFKRVKTGPSPMNVEYLLSVLRCKQRPLTDAEKAVVAETKTIDELIVRPTAVDISDMLDRLERGAEDETAETTSAVDKEAINELK